MEWLKSTLTLRSHHKGLYSFTENINSQLRSWNVREGMAYLFIPHTSASLVINENFDPSAQQDLESFLEHIAPEGEDWYVHTLEGRDDSPSHMRAMLTNTSLTIPIDEGCLSLGTWQGVYLAEHRRHGGSRRILLRVLKVN